MGKQQTQYHFQPCLSILHPSVHYSYCSKSNKYGKLYGARNKILPSNVMHSEGIIQIVSGRYAIGYIYHCHGLYSMNHVLLLTERDSKQMKESYYSFQTD